MQSSILQITFTVLRCILRSSKLYLACWEGLVLHRNSAVGSEHGDAQLLLSVQGLLVPLLHWYRFKGRNQCHLGIDEQNLVYLSAVLLTFDSHHFTFVSSRATVCK